eukprot:TRINITY_DN4508_c0_g1_i2.p1 TRINITY_DN4508_c0_g1~~TRINITY_DN4508_c0_g1_i2.p1  ORF type:complete len:1038 (-),score=139.10 TRINITY_DN4508_c0_g1_i2:63-2807(-)
MKTCLGKAQDLASRSSSPGRPNFLVLSTACMLLERIIPLLGQWSPVMQSVREVLMQAIFYDWRSDETEWTSMSSRMTWYTRQKAFSHINDGLREDNRELVAELQRSRDSVKDWSFTTWRNIVANSNRHTRHLDLLWELLGRRNKFVVLRRCLREWRQWTRNSRLERKLCNCLGDTSEDPDQPAPEQWVAPIASLLREQKSEIGELQREVQLLRERCARLQTETETLTQSLEDERDECEKLRDTMTSNSHLSVVEEASLHQRLRFAESTAESLSSLVTMWNETSCRILQRVSRPLWLWGSENFSLRRASHAMRRASRLVLRTQEDVAAPTEDPDEDSVYPSPFPAHLDHRETKALLINWVNTVLSEQAKYDPSCLVCVEPQAGIDGSLVRRRSWRSSISSSSSGQQRTPRNGNTSKTRFLGEAALEPTPTEQQSLSNLSGDLRDSMILARLCHALTLPHPPAAGVATAIDPECTPAAVREMAAERRLLPQLCRAEVDSRASFTVVPTFAQLFGDLQSKAPRKRAAIVATYLGILLGIPAAVRPSDIADGIEEACTAVLGLLHLRYSRIEPTPNADASTPEAALKQLRGNWLLTADRARVHAETTWAVARLSFASLRRTAVHTVATEPEKGTVLLSPISYERIVSLFQHNEEPAELQTRAFELLDAAALAAVPTLMKIFRFRCSSTAPGEQAMNLEEFLDFMKEARIVPALINSSTAEQIFLHSVQDNTEGVEPASTPLLDFAGFLEAVVRVSAAVSNDPLHLSLEMVLQNNVVANCGTMELESFLAVVRSEEVQRLFNAHASTLISAFDQFSEERLDGSRGQSCEQFVKLFQDAGFTNVHLTPTALQSIFAHSLSEAAFEQGLAPGQERLSFEGFCRAICFVSVWNISSQRRIELFLTKEVLPSMRVKLFVRSRK